MRPVQTLIWKITNVLATGKHDFEIFSGDEAKTLLGWDKNSKDSGKLQTVVTQKIREYLKIIVTSTPRYLKTSELISNYGNIKRLFDNIFIKPWSKHTFQGLGRHCVSSFRKSKYSKVLSYIVNTHITYMQTPKSVVCFPDSTIIFIKALNVFDTLYSKTSRDLNRELSNCLYNTKNQPS